MATKGAAHRPRRFLFSVSGGYGHLHPLVPLARALQRAGHDVAFAAGPTLRPLAEAAGFAVFPAGGNQATDPEYQRVKAHLATLPVSLETELFAYPRLFVGIGARLRAPQLVAIAQAWQPDMLIREGGEYGAVVAAEYLNLPHATVSYAAALQTLGLFERDAAEHLDPVRRQWGLPPDPDLAALYRYLYLAYAPPSFGLHAVTVIGPAQHIPATTHFIRPEVFDQPGTEVLPEWVTRLPEQPTVYVTLGTEVNKEPDLYPSVLQTIIAGLRDAPVNLIVTLGRDKDPADFGPQPAHVHIERYIPQSLLLPHCDLMVMHGGSNSLLAALDLGMPVVVVPLIADQFFNAHVTGSLGLGQVVQRGALTPATIRAAVDEVLANPIYRQNAERMQAEMHALPDQRHAVALVEQVAAERQALLNPALAAIS
ncbi:MAG TPA: glycosyltransferase [Chloroflexia bacterium]|nr:glycosyltransferase [Chloroflexia bacterium]